MQILTCFKVKVPPFYPMTQGVPGGEATKSTRLMIPSRKDSRMLFSGPIKVQNCNAAAI